MKRFKIAALILVILFLAAAFLSLQTVKSVTLGTVDKILVEKQTRTLKLMRNGQVVKKYEVSLGRNPEGKKMEEGDKMTPEGIYFIDKHNLNSRFYKSLHISYPAEFDMEQARARGVSPGSNVMIHGLPNGLGFLGSLHLLIDWTAGCIAVTNEEMDEIWEAVPDGTVIEILP